MIQHVYEKYGARGAGMTANVITYRDRWRRARSERRSVLAGAGDRLSKQLGSWNFGEIREPIESSRRRSPRRASIARDAIPAFHAPVARDADRPRNLGQHSGGMVIAAGRLDEVVPLEPASMPGRVVVQWDKDDCADLGMVKVDLLGLGMLAALEEALPMISTNEKVEVDLAHLPPDDPAVYEMLNKADTVGLFQVESRAQMHLCRATGRRRSTTSSCRSRSSGRGRCRRNGHPFFDRRRGLAAGRVSAPCLGRS